MKKIKLFCLPYAGGSAAVFKKWEQYLSLDIKLFAVELSGRAKRAREPLYENVEAAVNDIYSIIYPEISDGSAYAFYGHSMGAMLAYELVQKIKDNNLPEPVHMFFLGRGAPHIKSKREKIYHLMPEEEFREAVVNLGGTPREFFEYPELMDYVLPILKNDFKISETAFRNPSIRPLYCDITVFMGKEEDEIEAEDVHGWMLHTKNRCTIHYFNGGHFFVNDETEKVVRMINKKLTTGQND